MLQMHASAALGVVTGLNIAEILREGGPQVRGRYFVVRV
jgi:hypothetical protein